MRALVSLFLSILASCAYPYAGAVFPRPLVELHSQLYYSPTTGWTRYTRAYLTNTQYTPVTVHLICSVTEDPAVALPARTMVPYLLYPQESACRVRTP